MLQTGDAFPLAIFAIHLAGASSIMGAINIIVTIMNLRAPGMSLLKMPLFVWTWLITAYLLIAVMPVFAGAVTMLLTDHFFHTTFFAASGGGDPVLYQHIFWFFGHPEVYIMILPAFGIVSEIIPTFSRKRLFGYDAMVYATASIAFLSFIVWAHHMFTVGMPLAGEMFFMLSTMLIAVPTGVKVFNWTATMWKGSLTFEPPMLFALAFLFLFTIGGFSGLMMAHRAGRLPVPRHLLHRGALPLRAGAGRGVRDHGGRLLLAAEVDRPHVRHEAREDCTSGSSTIFVNVLFFPQHFLGLAGMPRRIPDYSTQFADWNMVSSIGALRLRPVAAAVRVPHRASARAAAPRRRRRSGKARQPRASSGRCRRRRRTTRSTKPRWSSERRHARHDRAMTRLKSSAAASRPQDHDPAGAGGARHLCRLHRVERA